MVSQLTEQNRRVAPARRNKETEGQTQLMDSEFSAVKRDRIVAQRQRTNVEAVCLLQEGNHRIEF